MFFLDGNENKKRLLFILVAFFTIFIIWQWTNHNPIKKIMSDKADNEYWTEFDQAFSNTERAFKDNFEEAELELNNSIEKQEQEIEQKELLEFTKEYLENKRYATTSDATSTIE